MSKNKDKRKKELEKEMAKLRKKLDLLEDDDEEFLYADEDLKFDPFTGEKLDPSMPPLPPKPPMLARPVRPAKPAKIIRASRHGKPIVIRQAELTSEQKERIAKEKEIIRKKKEKLNEELHKMRDDFVDKQKEFQEQQREYQDIRRELREKEREIRVKERSIRNQQKSYSYTWDLDMNEDIEGVTSDLEVRLGEYTRSILASVADSIKSSMGIAIKGAGDIGQEMKVVGKEMDKIGKKIGDKIAKEVHVSIGPSIPEDKLEEFYEVGATIVSAIGDPNRLRILKELERSPKYQKELSDITGLRGGTFKHHMDRLLDDYVKFVTQEVVRGRYLLTTRGREALKLTEIQFMRYLNEKDYKKKEKKGKKAKDSDEEFDVSIK
ncbi:MAG: ArsR family transcriptional regulator [Candidatus Heimdallarchaeota archaeon]|nr:MAG: ArsR family transcriptional regulator [Candidatus Heimdallarchaeota archaeon]